MEVVVNDFSLTGQFKDIKDFLDSLYDITIPMLDKLEKLEIQILSSYNSYKLKVTEDKTLYDMFSIRGSAEITEFKRQLQELLFDDPYWSSVPRSLNNIYECDFTEERNSFCLAEALERELPIVSFQHNDFTESEIKIKRNGIEYTLNNLYNNQSLLKIFRKENKLGNEDTEIIVNDMEKLIMFNNNGEDPGRLSGVIEGKLKEFRTSLTYNRQIRIFYFEKHSKIIFLNGFLKKTNKTPKDEIDTAKIIMKKLNN